MKIGSRSYTRYFEGAHYALLIGAKPRGPWHGEKRSAGDNGKIFIEQGKALNDSRLRCAGFCRRQSLQYQLFDRDAPCAQRFPSNRFFAMMRLDENRAKAMLARKSVSTPPFYRRMRKPKSVDAVTRMAVWGNHSSTQVPDFIHAHIQGKPALEVIKDRAWCEGILFPLVQKRGASHCGPGQVVGCFCGHMRSSNRSDLLSCRHKRGIGIQWRIFPMAILTAFKTIWSFPSLASLKAMGKWKCYKRSPFGSLLQEKIVFSEKELIEEAHWSPIYLRLPVKRS